MTERHTGGAEQCSGRAARECQTVNELTHQIIACAIEVHRTLGPGLLETLYEAALCFEFDRLRIPNARQQPVSAYYKGRLLGTYRLDVVVSDTVIVEVKSAERNNPIFEAQLLSYLRLTQKPVGLLINFNSRLLKEGVKRLVL